MSSSNKNSANGSMSQRIGLSPAAGEELPVTSRSSLQPSSRQDGLLASTTGLLKEAGLLTPSMALSPVRPLVRPTQQGSNSGYDREPSTSSEGMEVIDMNDLATSERWAALNPRGGHFLPLEIFDDHHLDHEEIPEAALGEQGLAPQGDPSAMPRALSLWRDLQGRPSWNPCRVVGRNRIGSHYLIMWEGNRKCKWVSRFNVRFEGEDQALLKRRRKAAGELQRRAEDETLQALCTRAVKEKGGRDLIPEVDGETLRRIRARIGRAIASRLPGREPSALAGPPTAGAASLSQIPSTARLVPLLEPARALSATGASVSTAREAAANRGSLVSRMRLAEGPPSTSSSTRPATSEPYQTLSVGTIGPIRDSSPAYTREGSTASVIPYAGWMEVQGKWVRKAQSNDAADAEVLELVEEELNDAFVEAQARAVVEARWSRQRPSLPAVDARRPQDPPPNKPNSVLLLETLKAGKGSVPLDVAKRRKKGAERETLGSPLPIPPRAILVAASNLEDELLPASALLLRGLQQVQRFTVDMGRFDIFGLFGAEYRHIMPQEWLHRLLPSWEYEDEPAATLESHDSMPVDSQPSAPSTYTPASGKGKSAGGSGSKAAAAPLLPAVQQSQQKDFLQLQTQACSRTMRRLNGMWESMKGVIEDSYEEEYELVKGIIASQVAAEDSPQAAHSDSTSLVRNHSSLGRSDSMSSALLEALHFRTQLERGNLTYEHATEWIQKRYRSLTHRCNLGVFEALRQLVENSIQAYADCIQFWSTLPEIRPLFSSYVEHSDNALVLRPAPESFVEQVESRMWETVGELCSLPSMQPTWQVDPHLDRPDPTFTVEPGRELPLLRPTLEASPILRGCLEVILRSISTSHDQARAILDRFREFSHLLDVTDYDKAAALFASTHGSDLLKWRDRLASLKELEGRIRRELPAETKLGLYRIDGSAMKAALLRAVDQQHRALLQHFRGTLVRMASSLTSDLQELLDRFTKPAATIEACYQLSRDMGFLSRRVAELSAATVEVKDRMELMEAARCALTDGESSMLWRLLALPVKVQGALSACQASMPGELERFRGLLSEETAAFEQHLGDLAERVGFWESVMDAEQATQWRTDADDLQRVLKQAALEATLINSREKLIGWPLSDFRARVAQLQARFDPYLELWRIIDRFTQLHDVWLYGAFFAFAVHELEAFVPQALKALARIEPVIAPGPSGTCATVRKTLTEFARYVPLIRYLRTPGLRERHWIRIYAGTGLDRDVDRKSWTLESLIQQQVDRHLGLLAEIAELATKELVVEKSVDRVDNVFSSLELDIGRQAGSGKPMLKRGEDVLQSVDEALVRLQSIAVSAYVDPHIERVNFWVASLTAVRDLLESWLNVQRKYLFLEPLFSSESLLRKMPIEGRSFALVDQQWCQIIERLGAKPRVLETAHQKQLREKLDDLAQRLDQISKGLNDFLNFKRQLFPRFFFLSNEELLAILVSSREPEDVQPYIGKVFSGVSAFAHATHEGTMHMESITSPEGEVVPLRRPVELWHPGKRLPVEVDTWLIHLEESLRETMKELTEEALGTFSSMRIDRWVREWPAQVALACSHVSWTMDVTWALTRMDRLTMPRIEGGVGVSPDFQRAVHAMREGQQPFARVREKLVHVLETLGYLIALNARTISAGSVDRISRRTLTNLLISQVLQRDVTETLVGSSIATADDFEWLRHLRQYWEDGSIVSRCVDTVLQYGYEYQGVCQRLVITPLTERAFVSMVSAINLCYGSALQGPAGTGKTETVKELARAVGRVNHVFNCSEGLDMNSVARFLTGVISTGAWICFDEFNLMGEDVLSVIAKQILTIQTALAAKAETITFEGRQGIPLSPHLALFVTMNPSSYGARSEVPDNVRTLFRYINMMVPDYTAIAEVTLYSYGFEASQDLAQRLTSLLKVVKSQLPRRIYDFDMRALKTVLQRAGALRQEAVQARSRRPSRASEGRQTPQASQRTLLKSTGSRRTSVGHITISSILTPDDEMQLCRTALLQINTPKLSEDDTPIFLSCLRDFFPDPTHVLESERDRDRQAFREMILEAARVKGLELTDIFVSQAIQLRDTMHYRHGVMMLGPPGSGKTSTRDVLAWALQHLASEKGIDKTPSITIKGVQKVSRKLIRIARERLRAQSNGDDGRGSVVPGEPLSSIEEALGTPTAGSRRPSSLSSSRPVTPDQELARSVANAFARIHTQGRPSTEAPLLELGGISRGDDDFEGSTSPFDRRSGKADDRLKSEEAKMKATEVLGLLGRSEAFVRTATINPKSMSLPHLYGRYESITSNWTDGIASSIIREECSVSHAGKISWVVLDGPVDPAWVENLNSLLDDSRKLCLTSGETISLRQGVNVILEVDDISRASPATISRCGVVFFDERGVTQREIFGSWVRRTRQDLAIEEGLGDRMKELVWHMLEALVEGIRAEEYGPLTVPVPLNAIVQNILGAMECIMVERREFEIQRRKTAAHAGMDSDDALVNAASAFFTSSRPQSRQHESGSGDVDPMVAFFASTSIDLRTILIAFAHGAVAGVLGVLSPEGLREAERAVKALMRSLGDAFPYVMPEDLAGILPEGLPIFECLLDVPSLAWVPAVQRLPTLSLQHGQAFKDIFVSTTDGLVVQELMGKLLGHGRHVILMGATGSGKTALIRRFISDPPAVLVKHSHRSLQGLGGGPAGGQGAALKSLAASMAQLEDLNEDGATNSSFSLHVIEASLSAGTTPEKLQGLLEHSLVKIRKDTYGAPAGLSAVMFVDDVSAAGVDEFGSCATVEFLRSWMETRGWFDHASTAFHHTVGLRMIASLSHGSSKAISNNARFLRLATPIVQPSRQQDRMLALFTTIVSAHFDQSQIPKPASDLARTLTEATVDLYMRVSKALLPVPSSPHYLFSMRHVARVVQGLMRGSVRVLSDPVTLMILWRHEVYRTFCDALTDGKAQRWFAMTVRDLLEDRTNIRDLPEYNGLDVQFCTFVAGSNGAYEYVPFAYERYSRNKIASSGTAQIRSMQTVVENVSETEERLGATQADLQDVEAGRKKKSKWNKFKVLHRVNQQFKAAGRASGGIKSTEDSLSTLAEGSEPSVSLESPIHSVRPSASVVALEDESTVANVSILGRKSGGRTPSGSLARSRASSFVDVPALLNGHGSQTRLHEAESAPAPPPAKPGGTVSSRSNLSGDRKTRRPSIPLAEPVSGWNTVPAPRVDPGLASSGSIGADAGASAARKRAKSVVDLSSSRPTSRRQSGEITSALHDSTSGPLQRLSSSSNVEGVHDTRRRRRSSVTFTSDAPGLGSHDRTPEEGPGPAGEEERNSGSGDPALAMDVGLPHEAPTEQVDNASLVKAQHLAPSNESTNGADRPSSTATLNDLEQSLKDVCGHYLEQYNLANPRRPLDMVLFKEVLGHLGRLVRVLEQETGHMVLLGHGGTGRRSLARLAGYILGLKVVEVSMKPGYTAESWREDLKDALQTAGVIGRPVMLVVRDSPFFASVVLDDLSHLVNKAEVPGLYTAEEVSGICQSLKAMAEASGIRVADLERVSPALMEQKVFRLFIERCRAQLRVCICWEQGSALLRRRLQEFPALGHCTTANFVDNWSDSARTEIALRVVTQAETGVPSHQYSSTIESLVAVHEVAIRIAEEHTRSGNHMYSISGSEYLQMLRFFKELFPGRMNAVVSQKLKYHRGVERMEGLRHEVKRLQDTLAKMRPVIQSTVVETEEIMRKIDFEQKEAEIASANAAREKEMAARDAHVATMLRDSCNAELEKAMPPLRRALAELALVNKRDIAELKALKAPPAGVKLVMEVICILLGAIPLALRQGRRLSPEDRSARFWEESMKVVSDFHFLESLINYDKDAMTEDVIVQIKEYVEMDQFAPRSIERVSKAATCMCRWVRALSLYHDTKKIVDPKRTALQEAEADLSEKEQLLQATLERLRQIEENLRDLHHQMEAMVAKKLRLEREEVETQERIVKAKRLLESLETEGERWQQQEAFFAAEEGKVLGDVVLASAFLAYAGPLTATLRASLVEKSREVLDRHNIVASSEFRLEEVTGRKDQVHVWQESGLPFNPSSIENAVIMDLTRKWALLIDPEEQASRWIRRTFRENRTTPLVALGMSDSRLTEQLFQALDSGSVLLLENLEGELSPLVDQVLNRSTFTNSNGKLCIQLGDMAVPYHERFKLYLTTIQRKPMFGHDLTSKMCVVNFTSSHTQLVEQLTNLAIINDHSELENERRDLTAQRVRFSAMLWDVENRVLDAVQEGSAESIIEDDNFFKVLQESQRTAREISKKAAQIANNEKRVERTRKQYATSVAYRAAVFFMAIRDMAEVNPAYQFSLKWFLGIYKQALESCRTPHLKQEERLVVLEKVVTTTLHRLVSRSLHDRDKVLLSLLVSLRSLSAKGEISPQEIRLLVHGTHAKTLHGKAKGILAALRIKRLGGTLFGAMSALQGQHEQGSTESEHRREDAKDSATSPTPTPVRGGAGAMGLISRLAKMAGGEMAVSPPPSTKLSLVQNSTPEPQRPHELQAGHLDLSPEVQPVTPPSQEDPRRPQWLNDNTWVGVISLSELPIFQGLAKDMEHRSDEWAACMPGLVDLKSPIPEPWAQKLRPFDRLLLIRILRPRVLPQAAKSFIEAVLGPECSEPVPSDLEDIFQQSNCRVPILLVLLPGYHPLPMLSQFADRKRKRLIQISLGRGQGPATEKLIRSFLTQPRWIVLENCHLAGDWMSKLKSIVDSLPTLGAHPDFRLWLTAAVTVDFPLSILQASLKVSDGLSEGLRSNLTATLQQLSAESRGILERKLDDDPNVSVALQQTYRQNGTLGIFSPELVPSNLDQKDPYQLKANPFTHGIPLRRLFAYLCFAHAILLERRHYGQLGWSVNYDFNAADLDVSLRQLLRMSQDNPTNLDLPRLLYLMSDSFYGGRIVDVFDRRLLRALLETVLGSGEEAAQSQAMDLIVMSRRATHNHDDAPSGPGISQPPSAAQDASEDGSRVENDGTSALLDAASGGQQMTLKALPKSAVILHPALPPLNVDVSFNQMLMLIDKHMPDTARPEVLGFGINAGLMKLNSLSEHILKAVRKAQGQEAALESIQLDADGEVSFHGKEAEILELAKSIFDRIPGELNVEKLPTSTRRAIVNHVEHIAPTPSPILTSAALFSSQPIPSPFQSSAQDAPPSKPQTRLGREVSHGSADGSVAVDGVVDTLIAENFSQQELPMEVSSVTILPSEHSMQTFVSPTRMHASEAAHFSGGHSDDFVSLPPSALLQQHLQQKVQEGGQSIMKPSGSFVFDVAGRGLDAEASKDSVTFPTVGGPSFPASETPAVPLFDDMEIWRHVLRMEVAACNTIIRKARAELQTMIHAFEGLEPLTAQCTLLMMHVHKGEVPKDWARWSHNLNRESLGLWVQSLENRAAFLRKWIATTLSRGGDVRAALPVVPLGKLFRPRSFLQAVLRDYGRRNQVLVNELAFECQFVVADDGSPLPDPALPPEIGSYVTGLHLRAAFWNAASSELEDARMEELYTKLPVVWIRPFRRDRDITTDVENQDVDRPDDGAEVEEAGDGHSRQMHSTSDHHGEDDRSRSESVDHGRHLFGTAPSSPSPSRAGEQVPGRENEPGSLQGTPISPPASVLGAKQRSASPVPPLSDTIKPGGAQFGTALDVPRGFEDHYWCPVYRGQGTKHDLTARLEGDEQEASYAGDSSLMCLPLPRGSKTRNEWATRGVAIIAV